MLFLYLSIIHCETIILKHNALWKLIFLHNSINGTFFNSKNEAKKCNLQNKFSILEDIDYKYQRNNEFEFLLEYPEINGYNRWIQKKNPLNQSDSIVEGYKPINISWIGRYWGGLVLSSHSDTLIDGSAGYSNYWYSIGALISHQNFNTFPGPIFSDEKENLVSIVHLFVRIDNTIIGLLFTKSNYLFSKLLPFLILFSVF